MLELQFNESLIKKKKIENYSKVRSRFEKLSEFRI